MKVIFIKDLKKVAKKGEIKEVKDGYAENFLFKNKYAVSYTYKNIKTINEENKQKQNEEKDKEKQAIDLKNKLEKLNIKFKVKTGVQDKVFGSVSAKQIKEELEKKGYKIDKKAIITNQLQSLGYHKVEIELYKDIKAILNIELIK